MPAISGPSMTSIGRPPRAAISRPQLLGVGLDELVDALDQRVGDPLADRQRRHSSVAASFATPSPA
jgi:hypothetical protein